jgi:hypothetical protein
MASNHSQNNNHHSEPQKVSPIKLILLLLLTGVAITLGYNAFFADGGPVVSSIPKAMQVKYTPSDFRPNLDEAKTLEILSDPQRFKTEFDALINNCCNTWRLEWDLMAIPRT